MKSKAPRWASSLADGAESAPWCRAAASVSLSLSWFEARHRGEHALTNEDLAAYVAERTAAKARKESHYRGGNRGRKSEPGQTPVLWCGDKFVKPAESGKSLEFACAEAIHLRGSYLVALAAFHDSQEPFLGGRKGMDEIAMIEAKQTKRESHDALLLARRHVREHGCR